MTYNQQIGDRLGLVFQALNLTPMQASRQMGETEFMFDCWIKGITLPGPDGLLSLAARYGVSYDYIFSGRTATLPLMLREAIEARMAEAGTEECKPVPGRPAKRKAFPARETPEEQAEREEIERIMRSSEEEIAGS